MADVAGAFDKIVSVFWPSIPGSAEIWIFVWPSFPPKLTQLSILPRKVNEYQHILGLICAWSVSHPGGVKDSHPLNITETGDKRRAIWLVKDLAFVRCKRLIEYWTVSNTNFFNLLHLSWLDTTSHFLQDGLKILKSVAFFLSFYSLRKPIKVYSLLHH